MTRKEIVQFFARRETLWQAHDAVALTADHAEDCVWESPLAGGAAGRPAIEKVYRALFAGFPDFVVDFTGLIIDDDRAVQIATMSGTDIGGFMDLPPTGKRFTVPVMAVYTLKDTRIVHLKAGTTLPGCSCRLAS